MQTPAINLVMLNRPREAPPGVFDDTVASVGYLLRQAGFRTFVSHSVLDPSALNILWGAGTHFSPPLDQIRAIARPEFSIIFNMEQIGSDSPLVGEAYLRFLSEYRVLDYNQRNITELRRRWPEVRAAEFPVLPSPLLAGEFDLPASFPAYDAEVAFYGAINERRRSTLNALTAMGYRVKLVPGHYGPRLSSEIVCSNMVLNIHHFDTAIFEVARCLRPLALGIPVVSERSLMPAGVDWTESGITFCPYADIPAYCRMLLGDPAQCDQAARRSHHFIQQPRWAELARSVIEGMRG
jgi:hypothetical protein